MRILLFMTNFHGRYCKWHALDFKSGETSLQFPTQISILAMVVVWYTNGSAIMSVLVYKNTIITKINC